MPKENIEPHLFVIFGASGDLTRRKILPAFFHLLQREGLDTGKSVVLGAARSDWDDARFRKEARAGLEEAGFSGDALDAWCDDCLHYESLADYEEDNYEDLKARIEKLEAEHGLPGNRVMYLALPPAAFPIVLKSLSGVELNESPGWTRLVIEKPFGRDLESARALNDQIHEHFDERQVYRIDHYLGKQSVQNLMAFRFANALFEPLWNRDRIERVEITVAESVGVGSRAGYFDDAGILRDMIQNHLTQLAALIAMEAPSAFEADAIRAEKIKVLRAIQPIEPDDVVLGQYTVGEVEGEAVPAYIDEENVDDDSTTETFAALRLRIANWRWQGVPFYLRTGKRLPERLTQIAVRFREVPISLFAPYKETENANALIITLQPDEGFDLRFDVKVPSEPLRLETQQLQFRYDEAFGEGMPDAYQTLLYDVVQGDQTLFVRADEAEASWQLYDPVIENRGTPHPYPAGSWGPDAVARLLKNWVSGSGPEHEDYPVDGTSESETTEKTPAEEAAKAHV